MDFSISIIIISTFLCLMLLTHFRIVYLSLQILASISVTIFLRINLHYNKKKLLHKKTDSITAYQYFSSMYYHVLSHLSIQFSRNNWLFISHKNTQGQISNCRIINHPCALSVIDEYYSFINLAESITI